MKPTRLLKHIVIASACMALAWAAQAAFDPQACQERCIETLTKRAQEAAREGRKLTEKEEERILKTCREICGS